MIVQLGFSQTFAGYPPPSGRLGVPGQGLPVFGPEPRGSCHPPKLSKNPLVIMNTEAPALTSNHTPQHPPENAMRNRSMKRISRSPRPQRAGFTLLELLLVLAILVVIGGIVTVNIGGAQTEAKINATKAQLNSLKGNITQYQIRMNGLPESLEALRDGPSDAAKKAKWVAPIITEIPTDAWENQLEYNVNGNTYEIRSGGVDGQFNTDDDITVEGS